VAGTTGLNGQNANGAVKFIRLPDARLFMERQFGWGQFAVCSTLHPFPAAHIVTKHDRFT
jgi:hypothetical protein